MAQTKSSSARVKAKAPRAAALRLKGGVKRAKSTRRILNGIPLKRKVVWGYDMESPEFKAARDRDRRAIRTRDWDRDGMQWVDAVMSDPDIQKWWR